ncbi:MAG TPA: TIM-barrel domain-containing protein, partial [Cytophagales bacterium]|nr:TIM-barrel domain-containing protein [Cytophagales bacterium]
QRLSISGVSFCGTDVGGFIGVPDGELFTRWIQLSFLHTFFRAHSSGDKGEKEPWVFGKTYEVIIKKFIELRYQLIPYIYTNFYFYVTKGTPMLKPLVFEDQFDPETQYRQEEFLVGNHMLSCPIAKQGAVGRWLYLPFGNWYNYFSNEVASGGVELYCDTGLEEMPLYIRAGAIIPFYPIQQYIGEKTIDTVTLKVYFSQEKVISYYYDDAGEGMDYKDGHHVLSKFETSFNSKTNIYKITQEKTGQYNSGVTQYEIILIGFAKTYSLIKIDSKESHVWETQGKYIVNSNFKEITIE